LQEFARGIQQLAHRSYPALPEDHLRREAGKAFADGVEDPAIKIQLLLGGEKTVNEALQQALELQAVLLTARPHRTSVKTLKRGRPSPETKEETTTNRLRIMDVAALTTRNCCLHGSVKEDDSDKPGPTGTL
jgi:hypothetical protein